MTKQLYSIRIKRSAQKEIRGIANKGDRGRLVKRIASLAVDPRPPGCVKLTGKDAYRVRQGKYRIIYTIEDGRLIVQVIRVAHRNSAYKK